MDKSRKIGLLINPVAGMGGSVGLKGTDNQVKKAIDLGAEPKANINTKKALSLINHEDITFFTGSALLGAKLLEELKYKYKAVELGEKDIKDYSSEDTKAVCEFCNKEKVELFIFAGGDGTARDIVKYLDEDIAVIGVPTGVKMQSAVFALRAYAVGEIVNDWISGKIDETSLKEVIDLDEDDYRENKISAILYGYLKLPNEPLQIQAHKSPSLAEDEENQESIALRVVDDMLDDTIYLVGPGSTTNMVMKELKIDYTLLGFDAILNKKLIAKDINEKKILEIFNKNKECKKKILLTPIGGQGILLGRGNQQISPEVLAFIDKKDIIIMASENKMLELSRKNLVVDTGDEELDKGLAGYYTVMTGYRNQMVYKVE